MFVFFNLYLDINKKFCAITKFCIFLKFKISKSIFPFFRSIHRSFIIWPFRYRKINRQETLLEFVLLSYTWLPFIGKWDWGSFSLPFYYFCYTSSFSKKKKFSGLPGLNWFITTCPLWQFHGFQRKSSLFALFPPFFKSVKQWTIFLKKTFKDLIPCLGHQYSMELVGLLQI